MHEIRENMIMNQLHDTTETKSTEDGDSTTDSESY